MTVKLWSGIEIAKIKVLARHQLNWIQSAMSSEDGMAEVLRYLSDETGHCFELGRLVHFEIKDLYYSDGRLQMMPNDEPAQMITIHMKKAGEEIESFLNRNDRGQFTGHFDPVGNLIMEGQNGTMVVSSRALS